MDDARDPLLRPATRAAGAHETPPALADELLEGWRALAGRGGALLDPACGEGALLVAAARRLRGDARERARRLHGIEIDPARADRARERVARALGGGAGDLVASRIRTADALDPSVAWPEGTAVVANPPWVSYSGRRAAPIDPDGRARLRACCPGAGAWPSLHAAFLARIARHVARERTGARVLAPVTVCDLPGYAALRRAVTARARLAPPIELGEDRFPGVVGPAVALELAPRERIGRGSPAPWIRPSPEDAELLRRLERFPRAPLGTFADPGVHTGNAASALIAPARAGGLSPIREGRDLRPFRLGPARLGLRADLERTPERRFRIAPLARYRAFPVLVRQTAARPMAALHEPAGYFRNSLLAARPVPGLDPAVLVAFLNGPVAAAFHRASFRDARQRAFPQVKVAHLASAPLPFARRSERPRLHDALADGVRALARAEGPDRAREERLERLALEAYGLGDELERRVLAAASLHSPPP